MASHALFETADIDPETGSLASLVFEVHYDQCSASVRIRLSPPVAVETTMLEAGRQQLERFALAAFQTATQPGSIHPSMSLQS